MFGPGDIYPYAPNRSYTPPDAPLATFKSVQAILGLERAVLVNASCHGTDNRVILDAIAQSDGRYRGVANVDASFSRTELRRLHDGGVRGVRSSFVKHLGGTPDMNDFHTVVARTSDLGGHVVLYFDAGDLLEYGKLLKDLPVPYMIDHMGRAKTADGLEQEPFQRLLELAADGDCWIKVSGAERISSTGPPFTDAVPFARALIEAAPERVLWGTDWPHPNITAHMPNDGDLVDLIPLYAPESAAQHKILVENPVRLYGFSA